jgi:hypothetical protein
MGFESTTRLCGYCSRILPPASECPCGKLPRHMARPVVDSAAPPPVEPKATLHRPVEPQAPLHRPYDPVADMLSHAEFRRGHGIDAGPDPARNVPQQVHADPNTPTPKTTMTTQPTAPTTPKSWFASLFEPAVAGVSIGVGMQASKQVTAFARRSLARMGVPKAMLAHPIAKVSIAIGAPAVLRAIAPRVPGLNNPVVQTVLHQAQTFAVANVTSDTIEAVTKAVRPLLRPLLGLGGSLGKVGQLPADDFDDEEGFIPTVAAEPVKSEVSP